MLKLILVIKAVLILYLIFCLKVYALVDKQNNSEIDKNSLLEGYIFEGEYNKIKLKISELDKNASYLIERNLENNSYNPVVNLNLSAESVVDHLLFLNDGSKIYIPESTKFIGYISEIIPPKSFNRQGFYKITFDKVFCPDGTVIGLQSTLESKSKNFVYSPVNHIGKTALNLLSGSLAGALFSYSLGGLGLAVASHGYSLATGAAAGGFIGTLTGIASSGKSATIEPGDVISIVPATKENINQLLEIKCENKKNNKLTLNDKESKDLKLEILSVKKKRDEFGDTALKLEINLTNNSNNSYRMSNFFLKDSQGKEYSASLDEDLFASFPPNKTTKVKMEFLVDHPKATHWLLLKDKNLENVVNSWKLVY